MLLLLAFVSIFTFLTIRLWSSCRRYPRGPLPLPLIGNIHQILYHVWRTGGIVAGYDVFKAQFGKVFTLWLGPLPTVYIADYDVAYESHVKRNQFASRQVTGGTDYIREGRGIAASNGEFWQEHRRFALTTLKNFGLGKNIMEQRIMEEFNYRMEDFQKTHRNKDGFVEVHASSFFDLLVGSIINQMLVSERFEQGDQDFENLKTSLAHGLESFSIIDAFCPLWIIKSKFMQWRTSKVFAPFDCIYSLVKKSISKRMKGVESGEHVIGEEGNDFIDEFLLKIKKDEREGVKSTFDLETLAIDVYDLWLAGQETTSTALTWAGVCLLNHPDVMRNLRKELLEVTGGNRDLSLVDKPHSPYLNATINEIQRIGSILNINLFRTVETDTYVDGQPLAADAVITTNMSLIHIDEKLFKDHTQFRPERFLENKDLEKKLVLYGIGKRSCLGESLARAELYLILGNLVHRYNLEPVGAIPQMKTTSPFALLKRPPSYSFRFVPI